MTWLETLGLALLQGLTEFLPISSSGHLIVAESWFTHADPSVPGTWLRMNVALHVGTLLSVLVFYRKPLAELCTHRPALLGRLLVATVPAGLFGVALKLCCKSLLEQPLLVGLLLPLNGLLLLWAAQRKPGEKEYEELSYGEAFLIGLSQAVAVLPGISRSGATIAMGLGLGLKAQGAAAFSFLLSIPVILGAAVVELGPSLISGGANSFAPGEGWQLLAGVSVAFVVGLLALTGLLRLLERRQLQPFAYWCLLLGASVLCWQGAQVFAR